MAWYQGRSRITVTAVEGQWPQRAVVTVRGGRPVEIPGTVGASHLVDAERWELDLEHRRAGEWCPNIRAVQGRWQEVRGVRTQLVHSRNRDGGSDRSDRNLVLRIERVEPGDGAPVDVAAQGRATVPRTSAGQSGASGASAPRTSAAPVRGTSTTSSAPTVRTSGSGAGSAGSAPSAPSRAVTSTGGTATRPSTGSSWQG
ncbi:hypothetical protein [Kitasatospora sp. NBC_01300]|uniref:hypothetical protein n=1 Tax=Kitasatospora sp. NBC_01300 TaxID=2903574 RepID=UPI00352BDD78|nr:hypothetical protein OG556_30445 [Kitasatospora sp. NBC_01300]